MKDLHSHIIYHIDDGSESLDESIDILKQAQDNGYTDLIITPHYRATDGYIAEPETIKHKLDKINKAAQELNIHLNLYLGNEITIDDDFLYLLDSNQVLTLADSKYVLVELPFYGKLENLDSILKSLKKRKMIPVIAHPERCIGYSIKDYTELVHNNQALLQCNSESLYNKYGPIIKNRLEKLLKNNLVNFIGSDIHSSKQQTFNKIDVTREKLINLTQSLEITEDLINNNIEKIIKNEDIKTYIKKEKEPKIKENRTFKQNLYYFFKRTFDLLISILLLIPFIILIPIIKISFLINKDHGPIFFTQARIGKNGHIFIIHKFRTMVENADEILITKILKNKNATSEEYQSNKNIKDDPRLTKVGKWLSKTSLDELPQILNIIKNDMSLIGNRPYLPREKKDMKNYYYDIIKTKPGLLSSWQLKIENNFNKRLELEQNYSNNQSLKTDLKIIKEHLFNKKKTIDTK